MSVIEQSKIICEIQVSNFPVVPTDTKIFA